MAGVDVGGDESVTWHVEGDNVRKDKSLKHEMKGNSGWVHDGVDEAGGDFRIKIKIPTDRGAFLDDLANAVNAARGDGTISQLSFTLPIEYRQHKQIQIGWNSDLTHAHPNPKETPSSAPKTAPGLKRSAATKGTARTLTAKASKKSKEASRKAKKKTGRR